MRIIKFRAKDKDNIWRYGIPIFINDTCFIIDNLSIYIVDKNTICEFTGLTDKNNVEIYEKDVIKYYSLEYDSLSYEYIITKHINAVEFINGSFVCKKTETHYKALCDIGLFDLKAVWNELSHWDDEEKCPYYDYIGHCADENITGLEVINNCN